MNSVSLVIAVALIFSILLLADLGSVVAYFYLRQRKRRAQLLNFSLRQLRTTPLPGIDSILRDQAFQKTHPAAHKAIRIFSSFVREQRVKKTGLLSYYYDYLQGMIGYLPGSAMDSAEIISVRRQVFTAQAKLLELSRLFVEALESGRAKVAGNLLSQIDGELLRYSDQLKELQACVQNFKQSERERLARKRAAALNTITQSTSGQFRSLGGAYWAHHQYLGYWAYQQHLDRMDSPLALHDNIPGPLAYNQQYQQRYHGNYRPWGQPPIIIPPPRINQPPIINQPPVINPPPIINPLGKARRF
jgi:hypothetical protein